jgi:hypothetical protein
VSRPARAKYAANADATIPNRPPACAAECDGTRDPTADSSNETSRKKNKPDTVRDVLNVARKERNVTQVHAT